MTESKTECMCNTENGLGFNREKDPKSFFAVQNNPGKFGSKYVRRKNVPNGCRNECHACHEKRYDGAETCTTTPLNIESDEAHEYQCLGLCKTGARCKRIGVALRGRQYYCYQHQHALPGLVFIDFDNTITNGNVYGALWKYANLDSVKDRVGREAAFMEVLETAQSWGEAPDQLAKEINAIDDDTSEEKTKLKKELEAIQTLSTVYVKVMNEMFSEQWGDKVAKIILALGKKGHKVHIWSKNYRSVISHMFGMRDITAVTIHGRHELTKYMGGNAKHIMKGYAMRNWLSAKKVPKNVPIYFFDDTDVDLENVNSQMRESKRYCRVYKITKDDPFDVVCKRQVLDK